MHLFTPQSPQTQAIAALFTDMLILTAIIFVAVAGVVVYCLVQYRERQGAGEPPPNFGSRTLEWAWTVISLIVVVAIFTVTVPTMAFVDAPQESNQPPDVVITGHQWWWEARYPNGATTANEIHIPAAKRLLARIDSADVIHDFWVPQLARKMDAVPGRASYIWLEADVPGKYQGACSEFCGTQHAWMHFLVIAEADTDFSAWLNHQAEPSRGPASAPAAEGARLFQQKKCGDCHAILGTPSQGVTGPDLTHVASREFLGAGISRLSPENLALWITNPQSAKPGNRMPDQNLSGADTGALTAYLETLQ